MRRYSLDQMSRALHRIVQPSRAAPPTTQAPMQNAPQQMVTAIPVERDIIDFTQAGPVLDLVSNMHYLATVQQIPVRQPGYIPRAPQTPTGNARADIPDQRLGVLRYPENMARSSYDFTGMSAPAKLQSIPGYVVTNTVTTRQTSGYPTKVYKAPRSRTGGGGCK